MPFRTLSFALAASALSCQGDPAPAQPTAPAAIEVMVGGKAVARVVPGHPCRATVAGVEVIVGGPPLVATIGDERWTAETGTNGTTFKKNDEPVARIHANQLFDAQGIPLVKISEAGSIANGPGRLLRKATAQLGPEPRVEIRGVDNKDASGDAVVTHTDDIVLAALLAAPEADATIRGLVACHLLMAAGS